MTFGNGVSAGDSNTLFFAAGPDGEKHGLFGSLQTAPTAFTQTGLVSSIAGLARHTDANLLNPWGFSETPDGRFRVSANGAGNAPLLTAQGVVVGRPIDLPPALGNPPDTLSTPNGNVRNTTTDFVICDDGRSAPATVLFSTEDGTIIGWNPQVDKHEGILVADQSAAGAVYKLLAMGSTDQGNFLYATNFHNNTIDVFDTNFHKVTPGTNGFDTFTDPAAPAGFAPFGIKNIDGTLFVTYAKQRAPDNHDDEEGPGNGFIDEFDTSGHFLMRFVSGTAAGGTLTQLNSPIGMAVAPAGYGPNGVFSNALLVGNFGDSHVSAFDLHTGAFLGQLSDADGNPLTLNGGFGGSDTKGLWGIAFGNGQGGADPRTLFFAAGINDENDGLFGTVTMVNVGNGGSGRPPAGTAEVSAVPVTISTVGLATALRITFVSGGNVRSESPGVTTAGTSAAPRPAASASMTSASAKTAAPGVSSLTTAATHGAAPDLLDLVFLDLDLSPLA